MNEPPRLEDLPPPPRGRHGWPWTVEIPAPAPAGGPTFTIVTPSFNQGDFLEETIRSVLLQGYPRLEYIVLDGGSTDESPRILEKYAPWLAHWRSAPDGGHYQALNEGFALSSGEILAWINSDDKYVPGALAAVGEIFARFAEIEWLTSARPVTWNAAGEEISCPRLPGYSREAFWRGEYGAGHFNSLWIQQESTFWRRSLWERAGGRIDDSLRLAGDFELWTKFFEHAELYAARRRLGGFRVHPGQKTATQLAPYIEESRRVFRQHGGHAQSAPVALARKYVRRGPALLRRLLLRVGLAHPAKAVDRDPRTGEWRIVEEAA